MKLNTLVVADPVGNVAEMITTQCRRLAKQRVVASTGEQALNLVREWRPEVVVLSVEITRPTAEKLLPKLTEVLPEVLIVGTYRTLSDAQMEKLQRLGINEFLQHPIPAAQFYRVVSNRYSLPFRQFQRFIAKVPLLADGQKVGQCLDISQGGLRCELQAPPELDAVLSLQLDLGTDFGGPLPLPYHVLAVDSRTGKHLVRGQFDRLSADERQKLHAYVGTLTVKLDGATY